MAAKCVRYSGHDDNDPEGVVDRYMMTPIYTVGWINGGGVWQPVIILKKLGIIGRIRGTRYPEHLMDLIFEYNAL